MPKPSIDLSDINLPTSDAEKPAEIDNLNSAGDDSAEHQDENAGEAPTNTPDDQSGRTISLGENEGESRDLITEDQKPQEDKPGETGTDGTPTVESKPEEKPEDKKEEPLDFHKHPDWIKREEEKKKLENDLAFERGKNEALSNKDTSTPEKKEEIKSAARIAEERIRKQVADGLIDPKDELELNRIYGEELEKELEVKEQAKIEAQKEQDRILEEKRQEFTTQVNDVYKEFEITDKKEKNKVADLAMSWVNDGTANLSINTLRLAADHLKAKGEIGKKVEVSPLPVTPVTSDPTKNANNRITQPSNEGGSGNQPVKKSVNDLRRRNLDDIVADFQKSVG